MKKLFFITIFLIIFQGNVFSETKKYWIDRDYVCEDKRMNFNLLQEKSNSWMRVRLPGMPKEHIGFGTSSAKNPKGQKIIAWGEVDSVNNDNGKGKGRLLMFLQNTKTNKLTVKVYYLNKSDIQQFNEALKIKNMQERASKIFKLKFEFYKYRVDQGGRYEEVTDTCDYR